MIFKTPFYQVFFRVCILLILCSAVCWFGIIRKEIVPVIFLAIILMLYIHQLIVLLNTSNQQTANAINAFLANDYTILKVNSESNPSYQALCDSLNKLGVQLQKSKLEYEVHERLYQIIIENASQAIVCFDETGKILVTNKAFCDLINMREIYHLNQLNDNRSELYNVIKTLGSVSNYVIKDSSSERKEYLLNCNEIKLLDKRIKIIFLSNIKEALSQKELESWTRLMRTIVHEIMNSVAPMTSLTDTLLSYYTNNSANGNLDEKLRTRTLKSLETIKERGEELIHFAENFRQIYQVPKPVLERTNVAALLNQVLFLFENEILQSGIKLKNTIDAQTCLWVDKALFKHVLINLIRNAIEAMHDSPARLLSIMCSSDDKFYLTIRDTGVGILPEIIDEVFTPFFTTKQKGTGIGLSLCRTIMAAHQGDIILESKPNKGTTVLLKFPLRN